MLKTIIGLVVMYVVLFSLYTALLLLVLKLLGRAKKDADYRTVSRACGEVVRVTKSHPFGRFDEAHNVYVMCDGEEICFDDQNLFRRVKVGDRILMNIHRGYDEEGQLVDEDYTLRWVYLLICTPSQWILRRCFFMANNYCKKIDYKNILC